VITNGYATLAEVKSAARILDAVDDSLLETAIETASRMVDGYCERRFFTNGTETRTYAPTDYFTLEVDDIATSTITLATSSTLDQTYDVTWSASDFQTHPLNATVSGIAAPITKLRATGTYLFTPYRGEATAQVTAVFGYGTAVPTQIKHATMLLAMRQFKRYDSPTGVIGFGDFGPVRVGTRLDPDVAMILNPFRKSAVGVA
jgi:hypothetical protein